MKNNRIYIFVGCILFASLFGWWIANASSAAVELRDRDFSCQDTIPALPKADSLTAGAPVDSIAVKDTVDQPARMDTVIYALDSLGGRMVDHSGNFIVDSIATNRLRDSLDTLYNSYWLMDTVTLPLLDTTILHYYDSLLTTLHDAKDIKDAIRQIKKEYRDSVVLNTPRILETFKLDDSLYYKRILIWKHDQDFNELKMQQLDTSYNYHFFENPLFKNDVDATYLGTVGSATLTNNYFKREKLDVAPFFEPYLTYSFTPETLPMYNSKTPYTELAYWGNPFINKAREESNIKILTTQNITPAMNMTFMYQRFGSNGMLVDESTDNRTFEIGTDFLGKKYSMNAAFLGQNVKRSENGGLKDAFWVLDTIVDPKTIEVNLTDADNLLKRRTLFITQELAIPFNFFRKDADSLSAGEGTVAYIGHSGEYSRYSKVYTDNISSSDTDARDYYNNVFNINETSSRDSVSVRRFENKFFIKLQPYANDGILSRINAGVGYQILGYYGFKPDYYLTGNKIEWQHNAYLYGGASGMFRKYLKWDASGRYNFMGYFINDFNLQGNLKFSIYPIKDGIHLTAHFETSLKRPAYSVNNVYMNHHAWNNDFDKVSESRLQAVIDIPSFKMQLFAGYALADKMIYYDTLSVVQQHDSPVHVFSAYLQKNFKLWAFHFDNRVLFQVSSNQDVLPLPKLSANLRYYVQFNVVKEVLAMQIGANAVFHTPYYVQNYSPDLGVFYNQNSEKTGNNPYVEAFINMQWKRACIYLKYTNALKGWPGNDYFSAYHYIRTDQTVKFGIFWPFYLK